MADNQGRGPPPRPRYKYWRIIIVVAIAAIAGAVLYLSIPIFFSPGSGMGEPIGTAELTLIAASPALGYFTIIK